MTGTIFRDERVQLYGILSDLHIPYQDNRKIDLAYSVMKDKGITHLIINGDLADFYNLNAHGPKDPEIRTKLDDEFQATIDFLSYTRKFFGPDVEIVLICGNHEYRLDRFVMANCPAFYNHLRIEKMLQLELFNIKWIPYNQPYVITPQLRAQHSPPSYSVNSARTSLNKKIDIDHIFGCTHRPDTALNVGASGKVYQVICNGWFGKLDIIKKNIAEMPENRRVYHFVKYHEAWGCSFTLASIYENRHSLEHIVIKSTEEGKNYCSSGGNYYEL